jgi:hypothetical protein
LYSSSLIIHGEIQEECDDLQLQAHITLDPHTDEETLLVDQMVEALWRLNRARRVESESFERMMDLTDSYMNNGGAIETDQSTGGLLGTAIFNPNHQKVMSTLQRYVTAAERTYRQCLNAIQEAIKRRPAPAVEQPVVATKEKAVAAGQSFPHESGFEPQIATDGPKNLSAFIDRC